MKNLILLSLILSPSLFGQVDKLQHQASKRAELIESSKEKYSEDQKRNDDWEKRTRENLANAQKKIEEQKLILEQLNYFENNKKTVLGKIASEVEASLDDLSLFERTTGAKGGFYRCIRSSVKYKSYASVDDCKGFSSRAEFTAEENKKIESWKSMAGYAPSQIKFFRREADRLIGQNEVIVQSALKQLENIEAMKERLNEDAARIKVKEEEGEIVQDHMNIMNCDENTPEVSLEKEKPYPGANFKGPFVGVPRDNQDGLGTCYANAAKNLLVSTSEGEDVASFLDLALTYKGPSGVVNSGLDGGMSCLVLKKMKEVGYCPQSKAPFEIGEKNVFAESLMGTKGSVWDASILVKLLHKFLQGKDDITRWNKDLSEKILTEAKYIIDAVKKNPSVKIPLPVVRYPIPSTWKLDEFVGSATRANPVFNEDKFRDSYRDHYRKFYPQYIRAVLQGKSQDEMFNLFTTSMKPFLDEYKLHGNLEVWKRMWKEDTRRDLADPKMKSEIRDSLALLKHISGYRNKTDEEFLEICEGEDFGNILHFMSSFHPLIRHLNEIKVDTDVLFDKNGKFRASQELMQLVVAPACLNKNERKQPKGEIYCDEGYGTISEIRGMGKNQEEQKLLIRSKVVASLVQGYAVGNTFGRHINTIVGIRFNKTQKRCEYLIRESQNGMSSWQSEAGIAKVMRALTEVRRK